MKLRYISIIAGVLALLSLSSEGNAQSVASSYGELVKQSDRWQIMEAKSGGRRHALIYADDLETLFGVMCSSGGMTWYLKADWVNPYAAGSTRANANFSHFIFTTAISLGGRLEVVKTGAHGVLIDDIDFFVFIRSNGSTQLPDSYISSVRSGSGLVLSVIDADFDGSSDAASKRTIKAVYFSLRGSTAAMDFVSQGCR